MYDADQQFAVYDQEDVKALITRLYALWQNYKPVENEPHGEIEPNSAGE